MLLTGAEILIEELLSHGVQTVFGYPGGTVLNIYDELYKNSDRITHVLTAHEQGAAHAADGYARATGKVGVAIATSGPGATNLVTGIANAYLDSVPVVFITGNVAVPLLGRDSFQEVDIVGVTQPVVKHNFVVRDIKDLEKTIKEAFLIANSGRKGPVLVDIPKNIQIEQYEYNNDLEVEIDVPFCDYENDFQPAIDAIAKAKQPFIYCGGGVVAADAGEQVVELSRKIQAPIGLSLMGLACVPKAYDLNLGMCGMHGRYEASLARANADLVIAVGVRFSDRATGNIKEYLRKCTVIHIDIDDAEINKNIQSKIGLCGNVKALLKELCDKVEAKKNDEWLQTIDEYKKTAQEALPKNPYTKDNLFRAKTILETLNKSVNDDTVIATDVGQHQMWTTLYYDFQKPRTFLSSGGLGTMGFGMGAAIGGCIGVNKRKTVLVTSEGSFAMNLNEMATAVSQKLPIIIIMMNNGVLGMVRQWQTLFYEQRYAETTLSNRKTDFVALAKAFGADGYNVTTAEELEDVIKNKAKDDTPCLINCFLDMDEKVYPMIPAGHSIDDIMLGGDEDGK